VYITLAFVMFCTAAPVIVTTVPGAPLHDERRRFADLALGIDWGPGHAVGFGVPRTSPGTTFTSVLIFGTGVGVAIGFGASAAATTGAARSMMASSAALRIILWGRRRTAAHPERRKRGKRPQSKADPWSNHV
jgi:hypothetical protein